MHESREINENRGATPCGAPARADAMPPELRGREYWRSLEDLSSDESFRLQMEREFQDGADTLPEDDRREFMKIMGASFALAGLGLAGCRRLPETKIAPYASRPAERIPGVPIHYASNVELNGVGHGVLVKSFDGRPIKVDGNPSHPASTGASTPIHQALVLDLYDPDRSRTLLRNGEASSWSDFQTWTAERFGASARAAGGEGVAILSGPFSGPSMRAMFDRAREAFPKATWTSWDPVGDDAERDGLALAGLAGRRATLRLDRADVVVALDADFLYDHVDRLRHARDFAARRRIAMDDGSAPDPATQDIARLYSVESRVSVTGASADERIPMRSSDVAAFAAMLASRLGVDAPDASALAARMAPVDRETVDAIVADLESHRGRSLIVAGRQQPAAVHALVAVLNESLGNAGETVVYTTRTDSGARHGAAGLASLVEEMNAGRVSTLVVLGGNPAYDAPADLDFAAAMAKVDEVVHLSTHRNETSLSDACTWHVPAAHELEQWNDCTALDGTVGIVQPLIYPLVAPTNGGVSGLELLGTMLSLEPADGFSLVRASVGRITGASGTELERRWRQALSDGFVAGTGGDVGEAGRADAAAARAAMNAEIERFASTPADAVEIVLYDDGKMQGGRFTNSGWLQELPDPMTKVVWDNALVVGPALANARGLRQHDVVKVDVGGRSLEAAVYLMPGHADRSASLALGYGRGEAAGRVGADTGFDANALRTTDAMHVLRGAQITKTGSTHRLAHTQDHGAADALVAAVPQAGVAERLPTLVRQAALDEYREHPDFAQHRTHVAHRLSLWEESNLDGAKFRWAMSVDLSTCTGCSACVTACMAENNVPVVGKDQVLRGREMHWMRIDRYFKGADPARPEWIVSQPVACLHCENAPCEQVCPVAATLHDEDGLNTMVYNRCIGTRYCANNCPYKVRRFNYFDYHRRGALREQPGIFHVEPDYYTSDGPNEWHRMQLNPDVTVRTRGVMEKCSFCTQRIAQARIEHKNEWAKSGGTAASDDWAIPDGAIRTACQDACPSEAIVFGDLNDPESRVARLFGNQLSFQLLEELNTKPRLRYLARVTKPVHERHADHVGGHGDSHGGHDDDHAHGGDNA